MTTVHATYRDQAGMPGRARRRRPVASAIRPSSIRAIRLGRGGDVSVVRDQQDGLPIIVQPAQQLDHLMAALRVQRAGRLVGEQQRRLVGQGPGDGQPLALAAGQHARRGVGLVPDAQQVEQVAGPGLRGPAAPPGDDRGQGHVLQHRHALEQVEELEHDADVPAAQPGQVILAAPGHLLAGHRDGALVGHLQARGQVQQRGLPTARRPGQGHELTAADHEVDAAQRAHRRVLGLEGLANAPHDQRGRVLRHGSPFRSGAPRSCRRSPECPAP